MVRDCSLQVSWTPRSVLAGGTFNLSAIIHMTDTRYVRSIFVVRVIDIETAVQVAGYGMPNDFGVYDASYCAPLTKLASLTMPPGRTTSWKLRVDAYHPTYLPDMDKSVEIEVPLALPLVIPLKVVGAAAGATIGGVVGYAINPKKPLIPALVGAVLGAGLGYGVGYAVTVKS